jgi:fatty-acyl-CoA synthase
VRPIDYFYQGVARDPNAIALETDHSRVSYSQLVADVEALASGFQTVDPTTGSRVGICALNTRDHLTALLATYAAGKVWVPLNARNGRAELEAMVATTRPTIIVADQGGAEKVTPTVSVNELVSRHSGRVPTAATRPLEHVQIIKFSGGTTGRPKGVLQSARCINTQAESILNTFAFTSSDRNLVAAPLTHGTSCFVLPILARGGTLVLLEKPTSANILHAFASRGITTTYLPPTMIYALLAEPGPADGTYPALRHLIYSAAPMAPDRIRAARALFGPVLETAYGQVEAPQIVTAMRAHEFDDERNLTSVGRATKLTRVEVMDRTGSLLPPGQVGEVVVRGDLVMNGYLDMPALTAETIVDGWLHTGDLGMLDERGYLFLRGRLREVIISGGFNVFPSDVEAVLSRHAAVYECSVFGVADAKWGEAVHAAVQRREGMTVTEAELIQFVKRELDSVKAPKAIHFVDDLPRNPVGKVSRRAVRALILGDDPGE